MWRGTNDRPSRALGAAIRTELRRRHHLRPALAAHVAGPQVGAAFRAELAPLRLRLALRAAGHHLAVEVEPLGLVALAHLLLDLLHLGLRLRGRDLLFGLRRAARAQPAVLVPADGVADPLPAAHALRELRLDFRHRG